MAEVVLATQALTRHFGGIAAVHEVTLDVRMYELHAVIGPNGAGKSTLINMLSGDLPPSSGRVAIGGRDVTGLAAHQISRLGVGRSYQKTNVFLAFSAFENCRLAAQSRQGSSMRFFRSAARLTEVNRAAQAALAATGLEARSGSAASSLSHGEQRQLEIAMTLATRPRLLLLDEPLAGMGAEESAAMVALLKGLVASHAILLVEHDMDAVFALADRLTVMVDGRVLASGAPAEIRANAQVQEAYLGQAHDE
ncbi:MAG: ABC transporter ATP-binding protein [Betaproteobacteria bacterium]|nr:ABC transporter ATP-binding protein [Betaproteobacteria bacterium]